MMNEVRKKEKNRKHNEQFKIFLSRMPLKGRYNCWVEKNTREITTMSRCPEEDNHICIISHSRFDYYCCHVKDIKTPKNEKKI